MIARIYQGAFGRLSDPIEPDSMNFCFNQPFAFGDLSPADIREEFAGLLKIVDVTFNSRAYYLVWTLVDNNNLAAGYVLRSGRPPEPLVSQ